MFFVWQFLGHFFDIFRDNFFVTLFWTLFWALFLGIPTTAEVFFCFQKFTHRVIFWLVQKFLVLVEKSLLRIIPTQNRKLKLHIFSVANLCIKFLVGILPSSTLQIFRAEPFKKMTLKIPLMSKLLSNHEIRFSMSMKPGNYDHGTYDEHKHSPVCYPFPWVSHQFSAIAINWI